MVHDPTLIIKAVSDTVRILDVSRPSLLPLNPTIVGVILGASISIIGNILLAKRQARIHIQNNFFSGRLQVYMKLAEISWEGYSVRVKPEPEEEEGVYPQAYDTYQHLKDWLNSMVELTDKNRLLLDQKTYDSFSQLNGKILKDLDVIRSLGGPKDIDWHTRSVGRKSREAIAKLSEALVESARQYISKTYKVKLEKVL